MSDIVNQEQLDMAAVENFLKATKELDRILLETVDAGIESGRSMGVIESYNFLVREGYTAAAEVLMQLVEEEAESRKLRGDA